MSSFVNDVSSILAVFWQILFFLVSCLALLPLAFVGAWIFEYWTDELEIEGRKFPTFKKCAFGILPLTPFYFATAASTADMNKEQPMWRVLLLALTATYILGLLVIAILFACVGAWRLFNEAKAHVGTTFAASTRDAETGPEEYDEEVEMDDEPIKEARVS